MSRLDLHVDGRDEAPIVTARGASRELAREMGFSVVDQTRIATAVSEIVRNAVRYAGAANVEIATVGDPRRQGLSITVRDEGPGIPDIELVLSGGYTTDNGFGRGISGSKALMDEFAITSEAGRGTTVRMVKWLD